MPHPSPKNVLVIAGEASGDFHVANLVSAMKQREPSLRFWGVGGARMKAAGVDLSRDITELAVLGITDVALKIVPILRIFFSLKRELLQRKPELVILVDYPGFNLRFARMAKRHGFKIAYYITPKVWAWGAGRIAKMRACIDKALVIFPSEEEIFKHAGIPVAFVGNPLVGCVKTTLSREEARNLWGLNKDCDLIALLPGSRREEINRLLPEMLNACRIMKHNNPQRQFIMAPADPVKDDDIVPIISASGLDIKIVRGNTYNAIGCADAAIATSGTITLETAILGVPMVIVYKVSPLTYFIAKILVKTPFVGLPNIVLGKLVAKELLQKSATPKNISKEIEKILAEKSSAAAALAGIGEALGGGNAIERAAQETCSLLQ